MVSQSRDARRKAKEVAALPAKTAITKKIGGDKNGGERVIQPKTPVYYPAEDLPSKVPSRKSIASRKPTKLRPSITPGTVLVLLAGRHRGRRVVCLGQLASGLLLITGPFKINGVPLRRVDQNYVIATSTKLDVSAVDCKKFDDAYFTSTKADEPEEDAAFVPNSTRVADQKTLDAGILAAVAKEPYVKPYLKAAFTLSKGQHPHEMKF